jgi:class 3 adenylate cyclase
VVALNEYFSEINRVIVSNKGVVSKYLGDTVMAIFGMPHGNNDHALHAIRAALAIPRALQDLYVRMEDKHGWELGVGIGIATGVPIVGHFGSSEHMEYTVLGDVVVDAHRMEELTKSVPEEDTILICETTYRSVMSEVHVFDMGEKTTKDGRTVHPYVVQGMRSEARQVLAA